MKGERQRCGIIPAVRAHPTGGMHLGQKVITAEWDAGSCLKENMSGYAGGGKAASKVTEKQMSRHMTVLLWDVLKSENYF